MPIWRARAIAAVNPPDHFTRERMRALPVVSPQKPKRGGVMGKGILLWLLGIPIPIIILLLLFWH
jgi:hypothetical protein